MPRGIRKQKFEPDQWVEAIQAMSLDVDGITYDFNSKSRPVRASHPAVQSNPDMFQALDPRPGYEAESRSAS